MNDMKYRVQGFTLIECLIYIGLLSFLLAGFVSLSSAVLLDSSRLSDQIHDAQNE